MVIRLLEDSDVVCFNEDVFNEIINDLFIVDDMLISASKEIDDALNIISKELLTDVDDDKILKSISIMRDKVTNMANSINSSLYFYRDVDEISILELEMFENDL